MNSSEAEYLVCIVQYDLGAERASVRELGNHESVVIITTKSGEWWCWDMQDYRNYLAAKTCSICLKEAAVRTCRKCLKSCCAVCRRFANGTGVVCIECRSQIAADQVAEEPTPRPQAKTSLKELLHLLNEKEAS